MKKIMTVHHVQGIPKKGTIVIGGGPIVDELTPNEIKSYINNNTIIIKRQGKEVIKIDPISIDVSSSLIDQKVIFILLPQQAEELIQISDEVYVAEEGSNDFED